MYGMQRSDWEKLCTLQLLGHRDAWASQAEEDTFRDSLLGLVISQAPKAPAFVRQLPRGTTPAACYAPQLRRLLALSMNWQVPVYEIDRVSKGRPLSTIAMWVRFFSKDIYFHLDLESQPKAGI